MKIDHKDSYKDFGEQFQKDNKVDGDSWTAIAKKK